MSTAGVDVQHPRPERAPNDESARSVPSWLPIVVLALVGGALPIALAAHFGALGIPRNDDWSYLLTAFRFADSGELNDNGFSATSLVGQLFLSLPVVWVFGHRIGALQVEVAIFGVAGLVAVLDLAKQVLSERRALFVALMVAVGPMWAALSVSYMTDVPTFALAMICLALGARAVRADRLRVGLLCAAVLFGFVAFTVREYALVAPLAVCLTALWTTWPGSRRPFRAALAVLGGLVAMAVVFFVWRRGLPGFTKLSVHRPSLSSARTALRQGVESAVLVGLLVSPAVVLAGPGRVVRAAWARAPRISACAAFATVLAFCGAIVWQRGSSSSWSQAVISFLGPGNYVVRDGTLGAATVSGSRPDLLPKSALVLLTMVGILSLLVLVVAAVPPVTDALTRVRDRHLGPPASPALAIVTLAALGYGLPSTVPVLFELAFLDRYVLPLVPLVGILVLRARGAQVAVHRGSRAFAGGALLALAVLGLVFAANAASFDGTKWSVAEQAARIAGSPTRVEGGFEWTNYHAGKQIFLEFRDRPPARFCIALRGQERPAGDDEELRAARVWGPTGTQVWIVARQRHPC